MLPFLCVADALANYNSVSRNWIKGRGSVLCACKTTANYRLIRRRFVRRGCDPRVHVAVVVVDIAVWAAATLHATR